MFKNFKYRADYEAVTGRSWEHICGCYEAGTDAAQVKNQFMKLVVESFRKKYGKEANPDDYCLIALPGAWMTSKEVPVPQRHPARFVSFAEGDRYTKTVVYIDSTFSVVPLAEVQAQEQTDANIFEEALCGGAGLCGPVGES